MEAVEARGFMNNFLGFAPLPTTCIPANICGVPFCSLVLHPEKVLYGGITCYYGLPWALFIVVESLVVGACYKKTSFY